MTQAVLLLVILATADPALSCLRDSAQDKHSLTLTVKDFPAAGGRSPGFSCEGTSDLPDGCMVYIKLYFGALDEVNLIGREAVLVKEGKFSKEISVFRQKNLAGSYGARVAFNPQLQAPQFQKLGQIQSDVAFRVGTEAEAQREHSAIRERLATDIRAIMGLGDEVLARARDSKGKPDPKAWEKHIEGWAARCREIEDRALQAAEYIVLGLRTVADTGLEHLRNILLEVARCGASGQEALMKEGLTRLKAEGEKLIGKVNPIPADPRKLRLELAQEARKILRTALETSGEYIARARGMFAETVMKLDKVAPSTYHDTLQSIVSSSNAYFNALPNKKEEAKKLHEKLDSQLQELLQALQTEK